MHSRKLLIAALMAAGLAGQAAAQPAAQQTKLNLTFWGVQTPKGRILAVLVDEAGWNGRAAPIQSLALTVDGDVVSAEIEALTPGRYAVKAFHDVDGDGKMSTNPFGMPTEPWAFSNNAAAAMGPPSFEAAAFQAAPGATSHAIEIQ